MLAVDFSPSKPRVLCSSKTRCVDPLLESLCTSDSALIPEAGNNSGAIGCPRRFSTICLRSSLSCSFFFLNFLTENVEGEGGAFFPTTHEKTSFRGRWELSQIGAFSGSISELYLGELNSVVSEQTEEGVRGGRSSLSGVSNLPVGTVYDELLKGARSLSDELSYKLFIGKKENNEAENFESCDAFLKCLRRFWLAFEGTFTVSFLCELRSSSPFFVFSSETKLKFTNFSCFSSCFDSGPTST
mmetsp:Transcript_32268/g.74300  ORF Transcript_32268/g.74300 Transcript_32268/m.74300 type:complete len:243 (-) Transcript_32268:336-1064(-)